MNERQAQRVAGAGATLFLLGVGFVDLRLAAILGGLILLILGLTVNTDD